jgi:hypothetical protein
VTGIEEARRIARVDDVVITAKIGQRLVPLPEGAGYPGFIFASGSDAWSVESALRSAGAHLNFEILTSLDVIADQV